MYLTLIVIGIVLYLNYVWSVIGYDTLLANLKCSHGNWIIASRLDSRALPDQEGIMRSRCCIRYAGQDIDDLSMQYLPTWPYLLLVALIFLPILGSIVCQVVGIILVWIFVVSVVIRHPDNFALFFRTFRKHPFRMMGLLPVAGGILMHRLIANFSNAVGLRQPKSIDRDET